MEQVRIIMVNCETLHWPLGRGSSGWKRPVDSLTKGSVMCTGLPRDFFNSYLVNHRLFCFLCWSSNSMPIWFHCNSIPVYHIAKKFCTWLSCHVQNFIAVTLQHERKNETIIEFELRWKKSLVKWTVAHTAIRFSYTNTRCVLSTLPGMPSIVEG